MSFVNRTIDDQNGDEVTGEQVSYSPAQLWTQGNGCGGCSSKPDASQAIQQTWHDGSRNPTRDPVLSLSFKFTGTAVYLFNILDRGDVTDVSITIDGNFAAQYANEPSTSFVYNFPVFSQDGLPFGEHTVEMSASGNDQVTILFDYALYTTTESGDPPSSPPGPSPITSSEPSSNPENPSKSTPASGPITTASQAASPDSSNFSTSSSTSLISNSSPITNSNSDPSSASLSIVSRVSSTTVSQTFTETVAGNALQPTSTPIGTSSPSSSTFPSPIGVSNQRSRHLNVGAIAGGIAGALSLVLLSILFAWLWYRRRNKQSSITPFNRRARGAALPVASRNEEEKPVAIDDYPDRKVSLLAPSSAVSLLRPTSLLAEREDTESNVLHLGLSSPITSNSRAESEATLQRELQSLQGSLAEARAIKSSGSGTVTSDSSRTRITSIITPYSDDTSHVNDRPPASGEEVQRLRVEIERLRASRQQLIPSSATAGSEQPRSSSVAPSPLEVELMRQISILRTEMEHMRMQQELGMIDEALPSYSPPSRPIPGYNA